jgi:predicted nucleotidyltransferase
VRQEKTDPVVDEFGTRVRKALGARLVAVYWFGSRAREEGRDESDYDLFLESATRLSPEERDRVVRISVEISGKQGVVMDVHYGTYDQLHGPHRFMTPFRETVLAEGVPV